MPDMDAELAQLYGWMPRALREHLRVTPCVTLAVPACADAPAPTPLPRSRIGARQPVERTREYMVALGRIGGYATAARHGRAAAVARGRASVDARMAGAADPEAALREQVARVRFAKAQKAQAARGGNVHSITERRRRATEGSRRGR